MNDFKNRLTTAIECPLDADAEIFQYWSDKQLDSGMVAEAVNNSGVTVLFRLDVDDDAEFCQFSWQELEQDLSEWRALGDKSSAGSSLEAAVADGDRQR